MHGPQKVRRRRSGLTVKVAAVAFLSLVMASCGSDSSDSGGSADDTSVVIATSRAALTFDPGAPGAAGAGSTAGQGMMVVKAVFETLLGRHADGTSYPLLATEEPTQIDPTTWEFKLRPGIEFTNGEPMNADAVVHSVTRMIDPDFASANIGYIATISGAEAVDDTTVRILTSAPDPVLPTRMLYIPIVPEKYSDEADFGKKPVGTGPYLFDSSTTDEVKLKVNPDYWGDAPDADEVTIRVFTDPSTKIAAYQAGEVDVLDQVFGLPTDGIDGIQSDDGPQVGTIFLDNQNGIASDPNVRKALNLAIDRSTLGDQLYGGFAKPAQCQVIGSIANGFNSDLEDYPYDPEEAKRLIAAAGAEGKTILLQSGEQYTNGSDVLQAIAGYWEAIGLKVEQKILTRDEYVAFVTDFRAASQGSAIYVELNDPFLDATRVYTSYMVSTSPRSGYTNQTFDDLNNQALQEMDLDKRRSELEQMGKVLCDDAGYVFLLGFKNVLAVDDRLTVEPRIDGTLWPQEIQIN